MVCSREEKWSKEVLGNYTSPQWDPGVFWNDGEVWVSAQGTEHDQERHLLLDSMEESGSEDNSDNDQ